MVGAADCSDRRGARLAGPVDLAGPVSLAADRAGLQLWLGWAGALALAASVCGWPLARWPLLSLVHIPGDWGD